MDEVLVAFLEAPGDARSQSLLTALITDHAEAVIREIINYKLRTTLPRRDEIQHGQDAEDVYSNVIVNLLSRLQELKSRPEATAINNFRGYVATITYNACSQHLRRKYPQRHSLKHKLRYLFTHQPHLMLWEDERGEMLCGYRAWGSEQRARARRGDINRLLERPSALQGVEAGGPGGGAIIGAATAALDALDAPLELDDLVYLVAEATGLKDQPPPSAGEPDAGESLDRQLVDAGPSLDTTVERRAYLEQVWAEICQLPLRQRVALLLNLKDEQSDNSLAFLPLTGVASLQQIAQAMAMTGEELVAIWNDLPLEDAAIAGRLGLTRQQVINLRKSARERLLRRLKGKWR